PAADLAYPRSRDLVRATRRGSSYAPRVHSPVSRARRISRPAKPARQTRYARLADASVRGLSSTPKAGGFTAAAASADRAMRAGRVPRMPRWLRQPRHGSRAWYCPFTLASGSDPRHESRVALLVPRGRRRAGVLLPRRRLIPVRHLARRQRAVLEVDLADHAGRNGTALGEVRSDEE